MVAYVIAVWSEERDRAWREEYGPKVAVLTDKYGGRTVVTSAAAVEQLEGDRKLPMGITMLEFPSVEQAKAWYQDPEYALLIKLRQTGLTGDLFVVDGT